MKASSLSSHTQVPPVNTEERLEVQQMICSLIDKHASGQRKATALRNEYAIELIRYLNEEGMAKIFIKAFCQGLKSPLISEVREFFRTHSEITNIICAQAGDPLAFEFLYHMRQPANPIDRYFINCKAGHQIYVRLRKIIQYLPGLIRKIYYSEKRTILVDNIGSGPGHDMIGVLLENPDLRPIVHVRNIDVDENALKIGEGAAIRHTMKHNFLFVNQDFLKVDSREADLVLLIGFLCPVDLRRSRIILKKLKRFSRQDGHCLFSTVQTEMGQGDPVTDFIMRFSGWQMDYKNHEQVRNLCLESGWQPVDHFYDELGYNQMTLAKLL